jgi:mycoredoxin
MVDAVTVYWRQRCPYCIRLRWQLRRTGLPIRETNIWKDAAAAARVREITGGDETVPTLVIGSRSMVNPTIGEVLAEVREHAPHLLERRSAGRWRGKE